MQQNETATSTVLLNGEQAKNELNELEIKAKSLRKSLNEAQKVGDLSGIKHFNKELKDTQKQMRTVRAEAFDAKKVLDNISGSSLKELYAAQKKIDSLLRNGSVPRNTAEWKELSESQRKIKKEISAVNAEMSVGQSRMSGFVNGINKYFNIVLTFVAAITGMSFAFRKLAEDVAHMDDVYSDVMKTTGMTREEVLKLNEELKKIDTRTSRESLNNLARDAGKLGIEGSKNILGFVEAGNQINIALGEDLGEDAIKNIGKMVGVFEKSTKQLQGIGLKEQMLAVGSAVNELGASSTASEPYLVSFAGRMGGISKQAKISMADILGYASALDQDMQAVEMSATSLQKFIMKVMGEPAKFAKIAGVEVKEFSNLLNTDANTAIKMVLKSLNEKGGFQELIPIFQEMGLDGARAVGVLSSMAGSIDKVDEAQRIANKSMAEGVSITNEYDIKNNNLAARLEKSKKAFHETALQLGQSLNPLLLKSTDSTTYLIKALVELPKWLKENKGMIFTLVSVIGVYILYVNRARLATYKWYVVEQLKLILTKASTAATLLQVAAIGYFTGATRTANLATKAFFTTLGLNPFVAIGVLIAAVTIALHKFINTNKNALNSVKALNSVNEDAIKNTQQEVFEYKRLRQTLMDNKESYENRKKALEEIQQKVPEYHASLTKEGELINNNTEALDGYVKKLILTEKIKIASSKLGDAEDEMRGFVDKYKSQLTDLSIATAKAQEQFELGKVESVETALNAMGFGGAGTKSLKAMKSQFNQNIKVYEDMIIDYDKEMKSIVSTVSLTPDLDIPDPDADKDGYKLAEENLEVHAKRQQFILQEMYREKKMTQEMYNTLSEVNEMESLQRKLELQKKFGKETIDTELAISSMKLKIDENALKRQKEHKKLIDSMLIKEPLEINEEIDDSDLVAFKEKYDRFLKLKKDFGIDDLKDFKTQKELELQILQEYLEKGILSEKDASMVKTQIALEEFERRTNTAKKAAQAIADIAGNLSSTLQGFQSAEENRIETKYQKEINAARKAGLDTTELEEAKNKEMAELRAKNADAMFAVQIAGIIASTAAAAIDAYASAFAVPIAGPTLAPIAAAAAIAFGASQVAQANAAREAAKEGYAQGGFTTPGGKYQPAGIVHAGEFVGNQDAVNHRPVRKIFNLIDYAQKTNSIGRITEDTIMHALSKPRGYAEGGFVTTNASSGQVGLRKEDIAMAISSAMAESTAVNAALLSEIQKGIRAKVSASGQDGVVSAIETYNKLNKNAKR